MEKIASFMIDHILLQPGIYLSRTDKVGDRQVHTYDLRFTAPNDEPVMNTAEIHTIEHLGATFLRNHPQHKEEVIYFGPMGCRTGFYLLMTDALTKEEVFKLVREMTAFMAEFEGEIPGAHPKDCGNYLDQNLPMAKYLSRKYLQVLDKLSDHEMIYPA